MGEYKVTFEDGGEGLLHYRTPGSKNGVRKYQNPDGSLTPEGYRHYGINPNGAAKAIQKTTSSIVNKSANAIASAYPIKSLADKTKSAINPKSSSSGNPAAKTFASAPTAKEVEIAKMKADLKADNAKRSEYNARVKTIKDSMANKTENQIRAQAVSVLKSELKGRTSNTDSAHAADYAVNRMSTEELKNVIAYHQLPHDAQDDEEWLKSSALYQSLYKAAKLAEEGDVSNAKLGDANKDVIADRLKRSKVASKSSGSSVKATAKTLATKAKAAVNSVKDKASSFLKKLFGR